ncbi:MAG: hypothetical protein Q4C98_11095 [Capnocytophaga sp.]|nr:hypothetical protein [Capnocytophaga sp.]
MSKNIKIKEGDVFVLSDITFENEEVVSLNNPHRLAKVIFISKMTKQMIAITVSKDIFEEIPDNVEDVAFSDEIFYTGSQLLKSGEWKIIGSQLVVEREKNLTLRMVGSSLYLLDEYLGVVPNNERKKYNKQLISGVEALYYKVNRTQSVF